MNTFAINQYGVFVTREDGTTASVRKDSPFYAGAKNAVLRADWIGFEEYNTLDEDRLAIPEDDSPEFEAEDEFVDIWKDINDADEDELRFANVSQMLQAVRDMIDDEIVTADELGIETTSNHEHDLSQWSGSPIFYPTREMAEAQANRWSMFWEYHDFGGEAPNGYRHATVPRLGMAPTAPEGYDWVCLPRTNKGL